MMTTEIRRPTYTPRARGRTLQEARKRLLTREPLCRHCIVRGVLRVATQIDHIVPLWQGGADNDANKQPLCDDCHAVKTLRERGTIRYACDAAGNPTDPEHPWNKESA